MTNGEAAEPGAAGADDPGREDVAAGSADRGRGATPRRYRAEESLLPIGVAVFALAWLAEALAHRYLFGMPDGGLLESVFRVDGEELFDKGMFLLVLVVLLSYVRIAVSRRRRHEEMVSFFDEANAALSTSLDRRAMLARVAGLTTPYLADWCVVEIVGGDGGLEIVAVGHRDPRKASLALEAWERYPVDPEGQLGSRRVVRTGRAELYPKVTDETLRAVAGGREHHRLLRRARLSSAMVVPISARGRMLGAITLVSAGSGRRYGDEDLRVALDLARRVALAVDNVRLYEEARAEIRERERAEGELRRSETSLLVAQRIAGLGSWEYDVAEDRARWSDELFRIFGFHPRGFVPAYDSFFEAVHPGDRRRVRWEVLRVLRRGEESSVGFRIVRPGGEVREVHAEYAVVRDSGSGEPVKMFGTVQDITDRKRQERELRERNEELARSNRELEQFAYVASHDLQEPLRMVASYTQLLKRRYGGELGEDADDFIGFAVDGARRMQALINDLLAYSRVGTHGKQPAAVGLGGVVEVAKKNLQAAIEESGAVVEVSGSLPVVMGDAGQLTLLFQNLISNAIKFRDPGRRPEVSVRAGAWGDGMWLFTVQDNGIGIDPGYAERIFVIFQRLHTRGEYPGTGIGLAVCKKIVERHGGALWVESSPGEGSAFRFTLRAAA